MRMNRSLYFMALFFGLAIMSLISDVTLSPLWLAMVLISGGCSHLAVWYLDSKPTNAIEIN